MIGALAGFNAAAVAMTGLGGLAPMVRESMSRRGLRRMFSLRSGLLLAVAFVEVLPEAWGMNPRTAGWGAVSAFAFLFLAGTVSMLDCCPEYLEECSVHVLDWTALAALLLHSFIDGLNLTMAFSAGGLAGAAVGTALALHKTADGFTLTTLFSQGGFPRRTVLAALALVSLATPAGSFLSLMGLPAMPPAAMAATLGFSGGSFVYIAAADILPRIHRAEDRGNLAYFALGLACIAFLKRLA